MRLPSQPSQFCQQTQAHRALGASSALAVRTGATLTASRGTPIIASAYAVINKAQTQAGEAASHAVHLPMTGDFGRSDESTVERKEVKQDELRRHESTIYAISLAVLLSLSHENPPHLNGGGVSVLNLEGTEPLEAPPRCSDTDQQERTEHKIELANYYNRENPNVNRRFQSTT